jgi:surface protein
MFYNCNELRSLDLSHFNTAKVTDMSGMFSLCVYLTSLDLSTFNTANVEAMDSMFHACVSLKTIYVGDGWSTAAVTESGKMFNDCIDLAGDKGTSYDNNHIDKEYAHIDGGASDPGYLSYVAPQAYACYTAENTTLTFYYDYYRTSRSRTGTTYDLNDGAVEPGWANDGTNAKVTQVAFDPSFAEFRPTFTCYWFYEMRRLESITGMNYLNTSEVLRMDDMFNRCYKLTSLDLSNFNTSNVTDLGEMFRGCTALQTIYVGDGWTLSEMAQAISRDVFNDCTSLVGGMGTTYSADHVNADYAHIDGGPSNPGYFTEKPAFIRGDVNGDFSVTIGDMAALIDLLLGGSTINNPAADCNNDGNVSIGDMAALIDYLLSNHW